ncbi:MAG: GGDEF domain-containing protein, partial [Sphaerochaetaceae bacterium]|nr:GGDEF domain-containing protein [Sphaerochaetaceae bacterium]
LHILFGIETLALIIFFFISGVPQGFSALWVCLIPTFALLVFGHKYGSVFSACAFLALTFCFWTPYGRSLLQWHYTEAFMLRFPVFYLADYLMSLFVEYIRRETQKRLQDSEAKYHHLYRHDFLTGLYNRYGFNERIEEILKNPTNDHLSVIIIDIDDFKGINDKYGHIMGDYILKAIANIINETICDCSLACRWGGEEFAILLNCNHEPKAIAEEIRRNIEKRAILSYGNAVWVTVSVGVCVSEGLPKKDISEILLKADNCLYESKKNGKNKVTSTSVTQKII